MKKILIIFLLYAMIIFLCVPVDAIGFFGYTGAGTQEITCTRRITGMYDTVVQGTGKVLAMRVKLKLAANGPNAWFQGALYSYADYASDYAETLLAYTENRSITLTTTATWYTFNFLSNYEIQNGTTYYLVLRNNQHPRKRTLVLIMVQFIIM